jgi:hypothetical protein
VKATLSRSHEDPYTLLLRADRPDDVEDVREVLEEIGIPYRSGLLAGDEPGVFFTVPREYLEDAQAALADRLGTRRDLPGPHDKFPWRPVQMVGTLILLHFEIVFLMIGSPDAGRGLIRSGALLKGATVDQPWRLLTSLFLHSDPLHVFWNGASMMVFAVPLMIERGALRAALIYFASGIGGAVTALYYAWAGTLIIGSSGAVALDLARANPHAGHRHARSALAAQPDHLDGAVGQCEQSPRRAGYRGSRGCPAGRRSLETRTWRGRTNRMNRGEECP